MSRWELILDPPLDGVTNMAVDGRLLREVENSDQPRTILRLYSWVRPTLSLGRSQSIDTAADMDFCRTEGIDVVHRPTGGSAVLHDDELTYAVVSNNPADFDGGSVYGVYRRISEALANGYQALGVAVVLAPETRPSQERKPRRDDPCFVSPSRYELLVGGRKIVGSAQRRLRRGFLQHGSMPIQCDRRRLARATGYRERSLLDTQMSGIGEILAHPPTVDQMRDAFVTAFGEHFAVEFDLRGASATG